MPKLFTEADWSRLNHPFSLLHLIAERRPTRSAATKRKMRLFMCGCCRRGWDYLQMEPDLREWLETAEAFADGGETKRALARTLADSLQKHTTLVRERGEGAPLTRMTLAISCACQAEAQPWDSGLCDYLGGALGDDYSADYLAQCALVRCTFGNPFRPLVFPLNWRSETTVSLAQGIYDRRVFDRLPILADALEETGCDNVNVLTHCRESNGLHARGCWVVDGVLGKG